MYIILRSLTSEGAVLKDYTDNFVLQRPARGASQDSIGGSTIINPLQSIQACFFLFQSRENRILHKPSKPDLKKLISKAWQLSIKALL